jgi:hypothetical protein
MLLWELSLIKYLIQPEYKLEQLKMLCSFYFGFANLVLNQAGMENAAGKLVIGQISEALFILAIPFLVPRIGVKKMLLIGMSAWILRYLCIAFGNIGPGVWMLCTGIVFHGVCNDFILVTG